MENKVERFAKSADKMPGTYGLPLIGQTLELFSERDLFFLKQFQRYGPVFKTSLFGRKTAVLIDPNANQIVLKDQADKFSMKAGWFFLEPLLGGGLFLQEGQKHKTTRKLMSPAFHGAAIANYSNTIQKNVDERLQEWSNRNPVQLVTELHRLTLLIACNLFTGTQNSQEVEQLSQWFLDFVEGLTGIVQLDIPSTKFGRARSSRRKLEAHIRSVIALRRKTNSISEVEDVLGILMTVTDEAGTRLSDAEIATQTLQLLFAGHETTTRLLCWALFELSAHPEWIKRLREELDKVLGMGPLNVSHLNKLVQLDCFLKEVERLYPPSFFIPRGLLEDFEFAGYRIPIEWLVMISPLLTHRLPELYLEPHDFDPDRFASPREEHKKHPFALIGFGGGVHRCLGYEFAQLEMKIFLVTVLRKFDWSFMPSTSNFKPVQQPHQVEPKLRLLINARS